MGLDWYSSVPMGKPGGKMPEGKTEGLLYSDVSPHNESVFSGSRVVRFVRLPLKLLCTRRLIFYALYAGGQVNSRYSDEF